MIRRLPALCLLGIVLAGVAACLADPVRQPSQVQVPDADQRVTAGPAVRPKPSPTLSPKPTPSPSPTASPTPAATPTASPSPSPTP
jgi:hypothetical protein